MKYSAILFGVLLLVVLTLSLILLGILFGAQIATGPQILTATSLWIVVGLVTARNAEEAGILHGLLAGFLGALVVALSLPPVAASWSYPLLAQLAEKPLFLSALLGAFWGSVGGMIGDIVRLIKAKRARRKAEGQA
ncbi:glyoxalase [bacterium endosymbiont of Escarpia laminata]|nr:MAG: glyoxalase [bacterium endosymbiont of Escarpia laminata]RLJ17632.1 MAG: glyoxalase [bacterium endosymbiont of Escarpia laminata]